jgi:hypothetical protein
MSGTSLGWNQKWRGPLREALDLLRDAAATFYEDAASELLIDPWGARDAYGEVADAGIADRDRLLETFGRPELAHGGGAARDRARLLLELQRATLLMYSSCGWFFDDVAGLESSLVIRFGAYAIDLFQQAGGRPPVADFLALLSEAKSNLRVDGTGADVFRRVAQDRVTARQAVAFSAMGRLIELGGPAAAAAAAAGAGASPVDGVAADGVSSPAGFAVEILDARASSSANGPALSGRARAAVLRTGVVEELSFVAVEHRRDGAGIDCRVGPDRVGLADLGVERRDVLLGAAIDRALRQAPQSGIDPQLVRLALEDLQEAPPEDEAGVRRRQDRLSAILVSLLSRDAGALAPEEIALAVELLDAAHLSAADAARRTLEERVWQQIDAGVDLASIAPLAERLGFSPEAIGAEVSAS